MQNYDNFWDNRALLFFTVVLYYTYKMVIDLKWHFILFYFPNKSPELHYFPFNGITLTCLCVCVKKLFEPKFLVYDFLTFCYNVILRNYLHIFFSKHSISILSLTSTFSFLSFILLSCFAGKPKIKIEGKSVLKSYRLTGTKSIRLF